MFEFMLTVARQLQLASDNVPGSPLAQDTFIVTSLRKGRNDPKHSLQGHLSSAGGKKTFDMREILLRILISFGNKQSIAIIECFRPTDELDWRGKLLKRKKSCSCFLSLIS